ncbi:MAG: hypothetical protein IKI97_15125 [Clostridia bacterium]|nr:hypothetical protein [Clostridia bacterium]
MKAFYFSKRLLIFSAAILILTFGIYSCKDNKKNTDNNSPAIQQNKNDNVDKNNSLDNNSSAIQQNKNDNLEEEIIINENYADSEIYTFTGTIDEFYEDGSILVYSPDFGIEFDYKVIVEFDENTVVDNFELKENQHIKFDVYSLVKKGKPLTVVASKLTLLNEVSTQREDEAKRIAALKEKADALSK